MSSGKREWQWNEDRWGYDGVHTYEGNLLWFTHKHNPHGGGGARGQSFKEFLENGPIVEPPPEMLAEIREVVENLIKDS